MEYTIQIKPNRIKSVDLRAASDACNVQLASAGETRDKEAANAKLLEVTPLLRDDLEVAPIHELVVEVEGGVVQRVYGDKLPCDIAVIVRDLDNIEAGDDDVIPAGFKAEKNHY